MTYKRLTAEQKDDLEAEGRLWVCVSCGHETDADSVGETCPHCGIAVSDEE